MENLKTTFLRRSATTIVAIMVIMLLALTTKAQVAGYTFAASSGTYTAITGGTLLRAGTSTLDSWASGAQTIPAFVFNGVSYTTAYATSNGLLTLGATAPSSTAYTGISAGSGSGICICPFNADLNRANATAVSEMRWETVGNEIIFQWKQFLRYGVTENFDFQVRLNTVTKAIVFVYQLNSGPGTGTSYQPQVGIRTSATDFNNLSVTDVATTPTWTAPVAGAVNTASCRFTSTSNAKSFTSGLTYTWTPPTCFIPTAVTSSAVTTTSATISWTAASPAPSGGYQWEVRASGAAGSGATGLAASGSVGAGVVSAGVTGLSASTAYSVYVRSFCGGTDYSVWTTAYTLTTACAAISSFPWTEGFEGLATVSTTIFPTCWLEGTGTNWRSQDASTSSYNDARTGSKYIGCLYSGTNDRLWTPGFQLTAGVSYDFSTYFVGDGYASWTGDVVYNTAQSATGETVIGASFITSGTTSTSGTNYAQILRSFTPPSSGVYYFGIRITSTSAPYSSMGFDDFSLALSPSCVAPTAVTSSLVTATTATISWTAPTSAPSGGYQWEVRTSGGAGSGATGLVQSGSVGAGVVSASVTGLSATTAYSVYVRSYCGGTDYSSWASIASPFTTPCAAISSFPWTEGFEGLATVSTTTFPACWLEGTGTNWRSQDASSSTYNDARTGSKYVGCLYSGTNDRLWTPGFQLTAGVSYDFSTYFVGDGYPGWTGDVVYNTSQSATGETVLGASFITSGTTSTSVTNYAQILRSFTPPSSGVYYFGIRITSTYSPYSSMGFDDFSLALSPSCVAPTAVTSSLVTATTATISWTAPTSAPSGGYEWEVRTSGTAGSGATGLASSGSVGAGVVTASVSGLSASTLYSVYVRSYCGGTDYSSWTSAYPFTTPCANVTLNVIEGFNAAATIPSCWSQQFVTGSLSFTYPTTGTGTPAPIAQEGTRQVMFNSYSYSGSQTRLVSPPITTTGTASVDAEFQWYFSSTGTATSYLTEGVQVQYSTDGTNWTNAGSLIRRYGATTGWAQQTVTLPLGAANQATVYVGFLFTSNGGYDSYLDAVVVKPSPSCLTPTAVTSSLLTATTATISWTAPTLAPSNGYLWEVRTSGTAGSGAIGLTASGSVGAGIVTANVTGLSATTTYSAYVRSYCGGTDYSTWASIASPFTTPCVQVSSISESFDAVTTPALPSCWSKYISPSYSSETVTTITGTPNSTPNYVSLYSSYASVATDAPMLISPILSNLGAGTNQLRFFAKGASTNTSVIVGTMTDPTNSSTFTALQTVTGLSTSAWTEYTVSFASYLGANQYIAFRHPLTTTYSYIYLDNVVWEPIPSCISPTAVTSSAVTNSTATISWTAPTSAPGSGYEYYVSTTATPVPLAGTTPTGSTAAGVVTLNLSSLTSATTYYVWVRSNCDGVDKSSWTSSAYSFITACDVANIPYTQDFESVTTPAIPTCTSIQTVTGNNWITASPAAYGFTTKVLEYPYNSSVANAWFYTQGLNLTAGTSYRLTFNYGNNSTSYTEKLKVWYGTSAVNSSMVNPIVDYPTINQGTSQSSSTDFTPATTGVYYLGFNAYSVANQYYLYLDNISVVVTPTCFVPTALAASVTGTTTATISWTASTSSPANGYQWEVRTSGAGGTGATGLAASGNTASLTANVTALTAATTYYVYVRSDCGSGDYSTWATTASPFTTLCNAVSSFPWSENFDAMGSIGNSIIPTCWKIESTTGTPWATGNTASFSGNNPSSLPNYLTCNYVPSSTDKYVITPGFDLTSGISYDFGFKYAGEGYSGWTADARYNTSQTGVGSTIIGAAFLSSSTTSSATYASVTKSFVAPTTGTYYFLIHVNNTSAPYYNLGFDDFSVTLTPAPTISSLGSASGCVGSSLVITGTNLAGATSATIGGTAATITATTATTVTVTVGSGTSGVVEVTTSGGVATSATSFTVNQIPATPGAITSNSPQCSGTGVTFTKGACTTGTCYWVTSATGTQTTNSALTNTTATTAGTYNVWVRSESNGCWSPAVTASGIVNQTPSALTVTPSTATICQGTSQSLVASGGVAGANFTFGTAVTTNTTTGYPAPYTNYDGGNKHQMLILASELTAAGLTAGSPVNINSVSFTIASVGSSFGGSLSNFQISMKNATANTLGTTFKTGMTLVYGPLTQAIPTTGLPATVTHNITPFTWNGVDNLLIETSYSNVNTGSVNTCVQMRYSNPGFSSTTYYSSDGATAATILASTTGTAGNPRPNMILNISVPSPTTWSPTTDLYTNVGTTTAYTGTNLATVYTKPTANRTYTATATAIGGCTSTATATITYTPTVGTPVFTLGATSTRCQGASGVTYGATATNNTSIAYSLDVTTAAFAGNAIVPSTGAVTYAAGWSGTTTVTATAYGCNGSSAIASHVVTITPTPTATISYAGSPYNTADGIQSVSFSGTSGGVYSSVPAGLSLNATTGAITTSASTPNTYTVKYTVAAAGGCSVFFTTTSVQIVSALITTYTGTGNWNVAGNWDQGIPTAAMQAFIAGHCTLTTTGICNNLTINPAYDLTVNVGQTLTINGQFTIKSSAAGTGSFINNGTVTYGQTPKVERYISQGAWHYITSPIQNAVSGTWQNVYLKDYNEATNGFNPLITPLNIPMTVGKGFALWSSASTTGNVTRTYTGTLNEGDHTLPLQYSGGAFGYNLIGNVFTSAITPDINNWTRNSVDPSLWVWNASTGNYQTWNASLGTGTLTGTTIPASQGFLVHATAAGASVTIMQSKRVHSADPYHKDVVNNNLLIRVAGNNYADGLVVNFYNDATNDYDKNYDVEKINGLPNAPQIATLWSGKKLSINVVPEITNYTVMPMSFYCTASGTYNVTAEGISTFTSTLPIRLKDMLTNQIVDLRQQTSYQFTHEYDSTSTAPRFNLIFGMDPTGISENVGEISVYANESKIIVSNPMLINLAQIAIYNNLGQLVKMLNSPSTLNKMEIDVTFAVGTYIVKTIDTKGNSVVKKVIIR